MRFYGFLVLFVFNSTMLMASESLPDWVTMPKWENGLATSSAGEVEEEVLLQNLYDLAVQQGGVLDSSVTPSNANGVTKMMSSTQFTPDIQLSGMFKQVNETNQMTLAIKLVFQQSDGYREYKYLAEQVETGENQKKQYIETLNIEHNGLTYFDLKQALLAHGFEIKTHQTERDGRPVVYVFSAYIPQ